MSARTPMATAQRSRSSASMNARRRSVSSHSVNNSSNWSTTTSRSGPSSRSSEGAGPGVTSEACRSPSTSPARTAATTPAPRTEDLPLPDAPTTASSRPGASRPLILAVISSRPKKKARSPGSNASRPRYGQSVADSGVRTPGPASAWMRSGAPSPVRRCGPRSTSEQLSGRCDATSSLVTEDSSISLPRAWERTRAARLTLGPQ